MVILGKVELYLKLLDQKLDRKKGKCVFLVQKRKKRKKGKKEKKRKKKKRITKWRTLKSKTFHCQFLQLDS